METSKPTNQPKRGFTIIEVILVLAIAGLIFAIVFSGLPAVQRARRDTARKQDIADLVSEIEIYASRNRGSYPTTLADVNSVIDEQITNTGKEFRDPQTAVAYKGNITITTSAPTDTGHISYSPSAQCDGNTITANSFSRTYAVSIKLEQDRYCLDSL